MKSLHESFPDLCDEVKSALADLGEVDLGRRFAEAFVHKVSCDHGAGYINLHSGTGTSVRTLPLYGRSGVVLDIGNINVPIGVEVLNPSASLKAELRRRQRGGT